jgi:hypothetical protein
MTIDRVATWMSAGLLFAVSACGDDEGETETQAGSSESTGDETDDTGSSDDPSATVTVTVTDTTESGSGVTAETSSTDTGTETETGGSSDTTEGVDESESSTIGAESSSSTGNGDALPDIDMTLVANTIESSAYTEIRNFGEDDCALEEACIGAAGERRLLRFDTITPNAGAVDFVVGNPTDNPENFEYGVCHMHEHFVGFAN